MCRYFSGRAGQLIPDGWAPNLDRICRYLSGVLAGAAAEGGGSTTALPRAP